MQENEFHELIPPPPPAQAEHSGFSSVQKVSTIPRSFEFLHLLAAACDKNTCPLHNTRYRRSRKVSQQRLLFVTQTCLYRYKIGVALSEWHPSDPSAIAILQPWVKVFKPQHMEALLVRCVLPKLAMALSELPLKYSLLAVLRSLVGVLLSRSA